MENKSLQFAVNAIREDSVEKYRAELIQKVESAIANDTAGVDTAGVVTAQTVLHLLKNNQL
jgi:hypothetical protein